jgi:ketol-acid reductoisomerase
LLADFMTDLDTDVIGRGLGLNDVGVDNQVLIAVNQEIRSHPVEAIGQTLRGYMTAMKAIV